MLELKDKVSGGAAGESLPDLAVSAQGGGAVAEAINALTSLGYTHNEATNALAGVNPDLSVEEMIKAALKNLAGRVI